MRTVIYCLLQVKKTIIIEVNFFGAHKMIYVTGDLHRENDIDKLYKIAKLEKIPDIVLIAGDFGGIWDPVQNTENGVEPGELDSAF